MKSFSTLLIGSGILCLSVAAGAGTAVHASQSVPITNGGTGYIGLTESAGQPRVAAASTWVASRDAVSRIPNRAGEASTMVNGRPNQDPDAPARDSMGAGKAELRSMGNAGMSHSGMAGAQHRLWGTPD